MPRGNRMGPYGQGQMTGRGMGYCAGNDVPGYVSPGRGMGLGRGRGFGAGRRSRTGQPITGQVTATIEEASPQEKIRALKEEISEIEEELKNIE